MSQDGSSAVSARDRPRRGNQGGFRCRAPCPLAPAKGFKACGIFLFLGPTGAGKTELAKAQAEVVFGDDDTLIRTDMSEYMDKHTVARLTGAPPVFVGYDEGSQRTEKVRRSPRRCS